MPPFGALLEIQMFLDAIAGLFSHDLAIDLGTANTLVYLKGRASFAPNLRLWR